MQNIQFTAVAVSKKAKDALKGVLTLTNGSAVFVLDGELNGEHVISRELQQPVENVENFIANQIRKLDSGNKFDSIRIGKARKSTPILREPEKPAVRIVYVKYNEELCYPLITDQVAVVVKTNVKSFSHPITELGYEAVAIPADGMYTKDPVLNTLYRLIALPSDYPRKLNSNVQKAIRKVKNGTSDKESVCLTSGLSVHFSHKKLKKGYLTLDADMIEGIEKMAARLTTGA